MWRGRGLWRGGSCQVASVTTHSLSPAGPLDPMLGQWPVLASETTGGGG